MHVDVAVIGAGIVGLATARRLQQARPGCRVVVLDKEAAPATHQTGRNSGVIHSGIYYTPGSVKARTCRRGRLLLLDFCRAHEVPHQLVGKLILAVDATEMGPLAELERRAHANGVAAERIGPQRVRELEPYATALAALHIPEAGIVDFRAMALALARLVSRNGEVRSGVEVVDLHERDDGVRLTTTGADVAARVVVTCAGLHSDRLARLATGRAPAVTIVPFRGEYHRLRPSARRLCRTLIYPVPDPRFPFLGVHLTRTVHGEVVAGPNAVLALAREGYRWRDAAPRDLFEMVTNRGLWRLARRHWATGAGELWRSASRAAFARALQRLVPALEAEDLLPASAGVRAQAINGDGSLAEDFVLHTSRWGVHVLNAPSPAATAALAIAERLSHEVLSRLG